jgi:hypothetical protein
MLCSSPPRYTQTNSSPYLWGVANLFQNMHRTKWQGHDDPAPIPYRSMPISLTGGDTSIINSALYLESLQERLHFAEILFWL